ncbi:hypothetical protein E2562_015554, partial [Oryza meyeriana var. granulata]
RPIKRSSLEAVYENQFSDVASKEHSGGGKACRQASEGGAWQRRGTGSGSCSGGPAGGLRRGARNGGTHTATADPVAGGAWVGFGGAQAADPAGRMGCGRARAGLGCGGAWQQQGARGNGGNGARVRVELSKGGRRAATAAVELGQRQAPLAPSTSSRPRHRGGELVHGQRLRASKILKGKHIDACLGEEILYDGSNMCYAGVKQASSTQQLSQG